MRRSLARARARARALALALALASCSGPPSDAPAPPARPREQIEAEGRVRALERELRAARRAGEGRGGRARISFGPDPFDVVALPGAGGARFVGLLRGEAAVVLLDAGLLELSRLPAPPSPTGLAVREDGAIFVTGASAELARYRVRGEALEAERRVRVPGALSLRDVALAPAPARQQGGPELLLVDEVLGRPLGLRLDGKAGVASEVPLPGELASFACALPERLLVAGSFLVIGCLLDHALAIADLATGSLRRVQHRAPIFSLAAAPAPGGILLAAGGLEDRPLDRTGGSFGYIDSFLFLYFVPSDGSPALRLRAINVSELGVVTPKALAIRPAPAGFEIVALGTGSGAWLRIRLGPSLLAPPELEVFGASPGASSVAFAGAGLVAANPLLDAFAALGPGGETLSPVSSEGEARDVLSALGEALLFTTAMAPGNRAEGPKSRFTCEACHLEGGVDGRIHATGRMAAGRDVVATTKPLAGLLENGPHFSRAQDPDLTAVAFNEFVVAGA